MNIEKFKSTVHVDDTEPEIRVEYDVGTTLNNIQSWPQKKAGYKSLLGFCIFILLYIVMLVLQLQVGPSYKIQSSVVTFLDNPNGNSLSTITTQENFWDYLLTSDHSAGIFTVLFASEWYNGQVFTTNDQGYILSYNKLVGGVLIIQNRGVVTNDGCTGLLGNSAYESYYPSCYTDTEDTQPYNTTNNPLTVSAFQYNSTYGGYYTFFGVADGSQTVFSKIAALKQELWTDKATRNIFIKFAFYNGNFGLFTYVNIQLQMWVTGNFKNGNILQVQSINMEPYRQSIDYFRATLEIIFLIWVAKQATNFVRKSYALMLEEDEHTGSSKGVKALVNLWTAIDAANLTLFLVYIVYRSVVLQIIYRNPIIVPTNEYVPILEDIAAVQKQQLTVNFLNIFIALLRFFNYYQFQERLDVLNRTFANAFVDLYHFVIMFVVMFGGYGVMAHFLFGPHLYTYSGLGRSLSTCFQMILGQFDYGSIASINPSMAGLFFITFMFLVQIVLFNILQAILIDAYTKATQDMEGMTILNEIGKGVLRSMQSVRGYDRHFNDEDVVVALKQLQKKQYARATAQDIGKLVVRRVAKRNPEIKSQAAAVADILADNPLMHFVDVTEEMEAKEEIEKTKEIPQELVDNIESILRENSYLYRVLEAVSVSAAPVIAKPAPPPPKQKKPKKKKSEEQK